MSSLLQSILSAKLSNASLEEQSASTADAREHASPNGNLDDWEEVNTSDEERIVGVQTAPATSPGTPAEISRPTSPGAGPIGKSGLSHERPVRVKAVKSKTDPLRSLPKEPSQRIFLSLGVRELLALSSVNKRYRRSATLNYCWYRQCLAQSDSENTSTNTSVFGNTIGMQPSLSATSSSSTAAAGTAHWTRRESKTDWKREYIRRIQQQEKDRLREQGLSGGLLSGSASGTSTPSRSQRLADSGVKTAREQRQDQWEQEAQDSQQGYTKNELRAYYKEAGGSKGGKGKGVKSKSGKGSSRSGADDIWE